MAFKKVNPPMTMAATMMKADKKKKKKVVLEMIRSLSLEIIERFAKW